MNCPECKQPMFCGENGWVCPDGHGKILPFGPIDKPVSLQELKARSMKYRKSIKQRGDELAEGIKGLE